MTSHRNAVGDLIHVPFRQVFADAAARTADATVYTVGDLRKKAYQVDTNTEYVLTGFSPTVWSAVGGIRTGGFLSQAMQQNTADGPQIAQGSFQLVLVGLDMTGIPATKCYVSLSLWIESLWADGSVGIQLTVYAFSFVAGGGDPIDRLDDDEKAQGLTATSSINATIEDLIGASGDAQFRFTDLKAANGAVDFRFTASRGVFLEV